LPNLHDAGTISNRWQTSGGLKKAQPAAFPDSNDEAVFFAESRYVLKKRAEVGYLPGLFYLQLC
jgi:hypothetical protein